MFGGGMDIGIDLGTANILVYIKGKGIVLDEPSVVAVEKSTNRILAVGSEARDMLGRTPQGIVAVRPLKEGVIANYTITQKMLEFIINKVAGKAFFQAPGDDLHTHTYHFGGETCGAGSDDSGRCVENLPDRRAAGRSVGSRLRYYGSLR